MPNARFLGFNYDGKNNLMDNPQTDMYCLEDILDDGGCIENTIYFNTDKELVKCINEIYERGYILDTFPMAIEDGNFRFPNYRGDEGHPDSFENPEKIYSYGINVIIKFVRSN